MMCTCGLLQLLIVMACPCGHRTFYLIRAGCEKGGHAPNKTEESKKASVVSFTRCSGKPYQVSLVYVGQDGQENRRKERNFLAECSFVKDGYLMLF